MWCTCRCSRAVPTRRSTSATCRAVCSRTTTSAHSVGTLPSESFRPYTLTLAPYRHRPTLVSAMCGQKKDGVSKLSALLFLIPGEEEDEAEDREENKNGDIKKSEEKKNCTTLRRPLRRREFHIGSPSSFLCVVSLSKYSSTYSLSLHTSYLLTLCIYKRKRTQRRPRFRQASILPTK